MVSDLGISAAFRRVRPEGTGIEFRSALAHAKERLADGAEGDLRLGRYTLGKRIGRGGGGVVFEGRDTVLSRSVAIKVVPTDRRFSVRDRARLRREAVAAARISHPNVVTVYDVGEMDGDVFFVMELVAGEDLARWLDRGPRTTSEIQRVFTAAGHGLAAIHRAGLVHRDFKPSNVLLGPGDRVRVSDFGLALLRCSGSDDSTPVPSRGSDGRITHESYTVGTPRYMAPEQRLGGAVDERADQYAFCVALFEALYGAHPDTVDRTRWALPSADVPRRAVRALRRGLAADSADRWPSIEALLRVLGGGTSRRWLGALAVPAVIGAGVGVSVLDEPPPCHAEEATDTWTTRRDAVRAAFLASGRAHAATTFDRVDAGITEYAAQWSTASKEACAADPGRARDEVLACLDVRLAGLVAFTDALATADTPLVDAAVAATERLLGAAPCTSGADGTRLPADPARAAELIEARRGFATAVALQRAGRLDDAASLTETLLGRARARGYRRFEARVAYLRGQILRQRGDADAAAAVLEEALMVAWAERLDREAASAAALLAVIHARDTERAEEADRWLRHAESVTQRVPDDDDLQSVMLSTAGLIALHRARYDEARTKLASAAAVSSRLRGADSVLHSEALHRLATVDYRQGDYDRYVAAMERILAIREARVGPEHPSTAAALAHLALGYGGRGEWSRAVDSLQRALDVRRRVLGEEHFETAESHSNLALALNEVHRYGEAREHAANAVRIYRSVRGDDHSTVAAALDNLAIARGGLNDLSGALEDRTRALQIWRSAVGPKHPSYANTVAGMGILYRDLGQYEEATKHLEEALAIQRAALGEHHPEIAELHDELASVAMERGDHGEAEAQWDRGVQLYVASLGESHPKVAEARRNLARARARRDAAGEALHAP